MISVLLGGKKGRILSGMKPTGQLHLGHLEGVLRNWVRLQDDYELFACVVDWHALTSRFDETQGVREDTLGVAMDYMAAGLDPERCTIFVQSDVKEHAELHLLLSMMTPLGWLERVPTWKEHQESVTAERQSYGLLGYPVLMAADIMVYKANLVPVGRDQMPHLELAREIVRRFNRLYGEVFPEPDGLLEERAEVLPGLDGRKMSKSYGNTISISDGPDVIRQKVMQMFTDPQKIRRNDPGRPEICPVYMWQRVFQPGKEEEVAAGCRAGTLGCVADKRDLAEAVIRAMEPIHKRRTELEQNLDYVHEVLRNGAERAREVAQSTMDEVRTAMNDIGKPL
jgi:tryptophanyl-tRNA synthetase